MSRRAAIGLGAVGVAGVAGAASLWDYFAKWRDSEAPADIFKGDAPKGLGDRLVQLTWKTERGFVYDRESFKLLREFKYDTEGWGITYDGTNLVMSDGSSTFGSSSAAS